MPIDISQQQRNLQTLRQDQSMTHQQIQALELLATPVLDLQALINDELEKNPVLEGEPPENLESFSPTSDNDNTDEKWLDQLLRLDDEVRHIKARSQASNPDDQERRQHFLESICATPTLQDYLLEQLQFFDLDPETRACCELVLSGMNDDGYLTSHPADLAMASGEPLQRISQTIEILQRLDPPGVCARDLRERLLLQLRRQGKSNTLTYTAIHDHLDDLANNRLPQVARKLKITMTDMQAIISEIQSLNPRLQHDTNNASDYVEEEASVIEHNGKLEVQINNQYLPNLYISPQYKQLLEDPDTPKETRDYIKEKMRAAMFLINSINQRQSTLERIVGAIAQTQGDFFRGGMSHMRPLTMAQIATTVGVHETTVSRAVSGKYLRCKFGLLPLRQFFSAGFQTDDGKGVSSNAIKNAISKLIDNEDKTAPLSDSCIAKQLQTQNFNVARRTVAKYREALGIIPSHLRKSYWVTES